MLQIPSPKNLFLGKNVPSDKMIITINKSLLINVILIPLKTTNNYFSCFEEPKSYFQVYGQYFILGLLSNKAINELFHHTAVNFTDIQVIII